MKRYILNINPTFLCISLIPSLKTTNYNQLLFLFLLGTLPIPPTRLCSHSTLFTSIWHWLSLCFAVQFVHLIGGSRCTFFHSKRELFMFRNHSVATAPVHTSPQGSTLLFSMGLHPATQVTSQPFTLCPKVNSSSLHTSLNLHTFPCISNVSKQVAKLSKPETWDPSRDLTLSYYH